ncbi:hypothetical protein H696_00386 [Fonticula alba]|uniref:FTP domain-containing protein n=1 Tax=Fonticula alba TaxID=691883 RepID=A0A058ZFV5_FONAL|nr:hypothetical protein H696_00386 [Fonticula alba]KCV72808.1 hypothetical protein H696_00386 [Fonticula alba]|eukprot:XP_009492509.1 hypothetical protein H696_00386 [Fonticula alba]
MLHFLPKIPPPALFTSTDAGPTQSPILTAGAAMNTGVQDFVTRRFGRHVQYRVANDYTSKNGVRHVYLRQTINGVPILNGDVNINIDANGNVLNIGSTFVRRSELLERAEAALARGIDGQRLSPAQAVLRLASYLGIGLEQGSLVPVAYASADFDAEEEPARPVALFEGDNLSLNHIEVRVAFVQTETRGLELVYHMNIEQDDDWLDVGVSATTGEVVFAVNWVSRSGNYRVYPPGVNDPHDGDRELVRNPHKLSTGSPLGWHTMDADNTFTDTRGNNVYAQESLTGRQIGWKNNYRPSGGSDLVFDFPIDFTKEPVESLDAAVTNLFYWNNIMHDIFYEYGFDEVSGNFQENNFRKGGLGNDAVQANAQDGTTYNNANFATPPDGQRPKMRMYIWNQETPMIDGDYDNGLIVHEYSHGISNRLCGGPANSNCMSSAQASGQGEGIGDCLSLILRWRREYGRDDSFGMAEYAASRNIRNYPYTDDMELNPQTFGYLNKSQYSRHHAKGEVWCTMLMDAYRNMLDEFPWDADLYKGDGANNRFMQNLVDGLKIQPCNPTFTEARDAILLADQVNYNGANTCAYWRGFARRGLGQNATAPETGPVTEDFTVPLECL